MQCGDDPQPTAGEGAENKAITNQNRQTVAADQERRQRAEALFASLNEGLDEQALVAHDSSSLPVRKPSCQAEAGEHVGPVGLPTIGGKTVAADQERRQRAEALFASLNEGLDEQALVAHDSSSPPVRKPSYQAEAGEHVGPVGFTTAGGKTVAADQERRQRAEALFASLNDGLDEPALVAHDASSLPVRKPSCQAETGEHFGPVGFTTAGGKTVAADQERRQRAEALFASLNEGLDEQALVAHDSSSLPVSKPSYQAEAGEHVGPVGFTTAGGKTVAADQERRQRAEALFASLNEGLDEQALVAHDASSLPVRKPSCQAETGEHVGPVGFTTAGGKTVAADQERRQRAEALFASRNEGLDEQALVAHDSSSLPVSKPSYQAEGGEHVGPVGFTTAGRKTVAADQERRQRAEALFASLNEGLDEQALVAHDSSSLPVRKPSYQAEGGEHVGPVGFTTAGGKTVAADQERRQRAEALFASLNEGLDEQALVAHDSSSLPVSKPSYQAEGGEHVGPVGFTTAGGKTVAADQERRQRAEALFASLNEGLDEQALVAHDSSSLPVSKPSYQAEGGEHVGPVGFTTAGGKTVAADQERRQRAEALFASLNQGLDEQALVAHDSSSLPVRKPSYQAEGGEHVGPVGFTTAGGKTVAADQERRQRAEALFANLNEGLDEQALVAHDSSPCPASKVSKLLQEGKLRDSFGTAGDFPLPLGGVKATCVHSADVFY